MRQTAEGPLEVDLAELHDSYIWHANAAVSAGRDDLAWTLAQEFPDEALQLLDVGGTPGIPAGPSVIRDMRVTVHRAPGAVAAELGVDAQTGLPSDGADRERDVAEPAA